MKYVWYGKGLYGMHKILIWYGIVWYVIFGVAILRYRNRACITIAAQPKRKKLKPNLSNFHVERRTGANREPKGAKRDLSGSQRVVKTIQNGAKMLST